jgi:hypothetical protein
VGAMNLYDFSDIRQAIIDTFNESQDEFERIDGIEFYRRFEIELGRLDSFRRSINSQTKENL